MLILHNKELPTIMTRKALITASVLSIAAIAALSSAFSGVTFAFDGTLQSGVEAARGANIPAELLGSGGVVTTIINTLLFVVGFLSVVMLIIGGIRYVISGGNSAAVTAAKNTILYAIVGLIIALFAYAIINFVIGSLSGGGTGGTNI